MEILYITFGLLTLVLILILVGIWALIRKLIRLNEKARPYSFILSLVVMILLLYGGCYSATHERSGEEIYEVFFGKPQSDCVKILERHDAIVPIIDVSTTLHFKTCPEEIDRIASKKEYTKAIEPSAYMSVADQFFNPRLLGDSVLVFQKMEGRDAIFIYTNLSKTEAYFIDAFN